MRALVVLAILPGCGLGLADDTSGGRVDLPSTGAGPFKRLASDATTPADEPWLLIDPILEVTEPALATRDGGGLLTWVTRESAELPVGDTEIWFAELPALRDVASFAPAVTADRPWEDGHVGGPAIVALPDRLVMFYAGGDDIGRAESTDGGRTWIKRAEPVLTEATSPGAAFDGSEWLIAFTLPGDPIASAAAGIGLARSTDGVTFTRDPAPILLPRTAAAPKVFDRTAIVAPSLAWIVEGTGRGHWALWYAGLARFPAVGDAPSFAIGYAGSFDGVAWQRINGDRPLVFAPAGAPAVVVDDNHAVMAYEAPNGRRFGVGLAATP